MNIEDLKKRLLTDGYPIIHEYDDSPGEVFPDHTHPTDQFVIVIRGSISMTMNGATTILHPGDELFFPANTVHSAEVGPEGCFYLDGERAP